MSSKNIGQLFARQSLKLDWIPFLAITIRTLLCYSKWQLSSNGLFEPSNAAKTFVKCSKYNSTFYPPPLSESDFIKSVYVEDFVSIMVKYFIAIPAL